MINFLAQEIIALEIKLKGVVSFGACVDLVIWSSGPRDEKKRQCLNENNL